MLDLTPSLQYNVIAALSPLSRVLYAIMFLCDWLLPSFAPRGVPSRASRNQITAGRCGLATCAAV
eukprot:4870580-Prymnesium_polylepis.1